VNKVTREFVMKINVKKTKVKCISLKGNNKLKIYVDGQQVSQFIYLGSLISEDGYCLMTCSMQRSVDADV